MADSLHFKVQGSAADPYAVHIRRDGAAVTGTCSCKAGRLGPGHCKHLREIIAGDAARLVAGSAVEAALADFTAADRDLASTKRRRDKASARLGEMLRPG